MLVRVPYLREPYDVITEVVDERADAGGGLHEFQERRERRRPVNVDNFMHLIDPQEESENFASGRYRIFEFLRLLITVYGFQLVLVVLAPFHASAIQVSVILQQLQTLVAALRRVQQILHIVGILDKHVILFNELFVYIREAV